VDFCELGNESLNSLKAGNFFISWGTIDFSRKILHQGMRK